MSRTLLRVTVLGVCLALLAQAQQATPKHARRRRRPRAAASPCAVLDAASARAGREEAARFAAMLQPYLRGHEQTIVLAQGTANVSATQPAAGAAGTGPAAAEFLVPVDSSVGDIVFSAFLQCKQEILIDQPNGTSLGSSDAGVADHSVRNGRIVTVAHPGTGLWRIRLFGRGQFSARADAESSLLISRAEFVAPSGRPGVYLPIQGPPRMGVTQALEIHLAGPVATARFGLVPAEGGLLQTSSLPEVQGARNEKVFRGTVTVNLESFRLVVEGEDAHGFPYQRLDSRVFHTRPGSGQEL